MNGDRSLAVSSAALVLECYALLPHRGEPAPGRAPIPDSTMALGLATHTDRASRPRRRSHSAVARDDVVREYIGAGRKGPEVTLPRAPFPLLRATGKSNSGALSYHCEDASIEHAEVVFHEVVEVRTDTIK